MDPEESCIERSDRFVEAEFGELSAEVQSYFDSGFSITAHYANLFALVHS